MNRKGIELPINAMVVLSLGIIVMVAIVGFYVMSWRSTQSTTEQQTEFRNQCLTYTNRGCCVENAGCTIDADSALGKAATSVGIPNKDVHKVCCSNR